MEITDDLLKKETEEDKKDEIVMMKELSNRRKYKKFYDEVRTEERVKYCNKLEWPIGRRTRSFIREWNGTTL